MNELLSYLQSSPLHEIAGSRVSARIPIAASLLNRIAADALRSRAPAIEAIDIRPCDGDRFEVAVTLTWPFATRLAILVTIERQPDFPDSPVLVLRWSLPGRLGAIAEQLTRAVHILPAGVEMEGDRLSLHLPTLVASTAAAPLMRRVNRAQLHTMEGHALLEVDLSVDA